MALKLPFIGRDAKADAKPAKSKAQAAPRAAGMAGRPLPLIGRMTTGKQLQILTGLLVLFLAADAVIVALDTRQGNFGTQWIASVGKIQMLSQRLAKAAQQASQGNREAFKQLRESRDEFGSLMKVLADGGVLAGVSLPPTPEAVRPALESLNREWLKTEKNASLVIGEEKNLVALGQAVRSINNNNPTLQELADEISALSVQQGGSARQNQITSQMMMLTQRMAKNANTMLAEEVVDPEVAFLLGKDTNTYRDTLQGLLQGSDSQRISRVSDAELRGKLGELESSFKDYQVAVANILGNQQRLVNAKRATRDIFNQSENVLTAAAQLSAGYEKDQEKRQVNFVALGVVSLLAFVMLLLVGKVYIDDSRHRMEDSEKQSRSNQDAILRLLDEIGNLANGDLTVRAKVTEEVTGAIADSINYTIDELRRLVTGITSAATEVTAATQQAQNVTGQLLQAAQKQSNEIQGTGRVDGGALSLRVKTKTPAGPREETVSGSLAQAVSSTKKG